MSQAAGIDVSRWQGQIDWAKVKASGIAFAFCKATEGTTFRDPLFERNWQGIKDNGILRGAYHFFRPKFNAVGQALWLAETASDPDLPLAVDVETYDGMVKEDVQAAVGACVDELVRLTGRRPLVYTSVRQWPGGSVDADLWIADYRSISEPKTPDGWTCCRFWQHTAKGTIDGVAGHVDLDWYSGTIDELQSWLSPPPDNSLIGKWFARLAQHR